MLCARENFRLCTMMLIEEIVESLCVQTPIIIQNVCVLLGDHRSLCMTGIALHGFDIAAVQLELVCNAGVSEAVENHFGEIVFLNQLLQLSLAWLRPWKIGRLIDKVT